MIEETKEKIMKIVKRIKPCKEFSIGCRCAYCRGEMAGFVKGYSHARVFIGFEKKRRERHDTGI